MFSHWRFCTTRQNQTEADNASFPVTLFSGSPNSYPEVHQRLTISHIPLFLVSPFLAPPATQRIIGGWPLLKYFFFSCPLFLLPLIPLLCIVKAPVSGHRSASKSVRFLFCCCCFFANRKIRDTCIRGDQISHIQSMAVKRGLTNCEKTFKTQHGRIPIEPAILAAKLKCRRAGLRRRARIPETGCTL